MDARHARILIVRLSAIGDVVHGLPVLCALREHLPGAYLAWMVEGKPGDLLSGHRALDELIRVPRGWLKSPRTVWQLRQRLKSLRFDIAIDVQGLTKSALAAWLSGARQRVGFAGVDGRELSGWLNNHRVEPQGTHVIDRNLELLTALNIVRPQVRFDLPRLPADEARASEILSTAGLTGGFVVVNPGAGWTSKLWLPERFAAVARHLGRDRGLPSLVVWAGAQERAWAESIVAGADGHAQLAPSTSLTELVALLRRARLFVGSDTGPLHMAVAAGTSCVGLFGPVSALRNGPYGGGHAAVQKVCLTGTSRERRTAGPSSMAAITVEDVAAACDRVLSRQKKVA